MDRGAKAVGRSHMRLSVVVPIGVIVVVAIVCVIVAVLSSARHADEVAVVHERQLFIRSLTNHAKRVLRETESIATSEAAAEKIGAAFDPEWVQTNVGQRLQSFFEHDIVFVTDANDRLLYGSPESRNLEQNWFTSIRPNLQPLLDELRGRAPHPPLAVAAIELSNAVATHRALRLQTFLTQPAIVAAVAVGPLADAGQDGQPGGKAVLSVKFIDDDMLAEIASRLELRNLREIGNRSAPAGDYVFDLKDPQGRSIARFAWMPKQPGAQIVQSVLPFIAVALAGFALLAGLVLHHMRRTA
ncbi:MAG TPA: CHASE4 domain-containing protein, partial [Vicinamibacterales bacterium]